MNPSLVGWLGVSVMLLLLALGVPVYAVMVCVGFFGYWVLDGTAASFAMISLVPYAKLAIYAFTVVPLFILMGNVFSFAGYGADLYAATRQWLGRLPGGLAHATIAACTLFGAISGSSIASAATFAKVTIPQMLRFGYSPRLAVGTVAAGGTIAQMIPPSVIMLIYGLITQQSIARLLIAGIIPGLISALVYMVLIYSWARRYPQDAPPYVVPWSWRQNALETRKIWPVLTIAGGVILGIYAGVFTPTEAAAAGALGAIVLALASGRLTRRTFGQSLLESVHTTVMIHVILLGSFVFGHFLTLTLLPQAIASFITDSGLPPLVVLIGIMVFYIIVGGLMDMLSAIFITVPILFPAIVALGYDPIWFGVLVVKVVEIGMITPPFALNLFVVKGTLPDVEMRDIIYGALPFIVADCVTLAIYVAFPQVALFLPNQMLGR